MCQLASQPASPRVRVCVSARNVCPYIITLECFFVCLFLLFFLLLLLLFQTLVHVLGLEPFLIFTIDGALTRIETLLIRTEPHED